MLFIEQILRNEEGINVLNDSFDSIKLSEKNIIVKKYGLTGLYDANTFSKILECEWDRIIFERNYIIVSKNSLFGVFDKNGNQILNANWDRIILLEKGILVSKNGKQGYFNYDGEVVLECIWKRLEPYSNLIIAFFGNGARRRYFDYLGNEIEGKK